ncbi:MAG: homoserine kinase [Cytophagales bacterium]|nr:homoserine kinase [Cytophagales bacterium]
MAVYTTVTFEQAAPFLADLGLGALQDIQPCKGGIENTNYFVDTVRGGAQHSYVLTLFERLSAEQLPFYLELMRHLAKAGIAVPMPVADVSGRILHSLSHKPACVVNKLAGRNDGAVTANRCEQVGAMLARMHLAGRDYSLAQPNLRGLAWWNETIPTVLPHLDAAQAKLIQSELAYQNHIAAGSAYAALPRGAVHADLFRDNVMFDVVDGHDLLTGFFDFYFAGIDTWLFDICVCLNDWCIDHATGAADDALQASFLKGYEGIRPLTQAERGLQAAMLRGAALRFWTSRLWDFYLPREASFLTPHDPTHFERVLQHRLGFPPSRG